MDALKKKVEQIESEHKRFAEVLAAHKNKQSHDAFLKRSDAAMLACRRSGGNMENCMSRPDKFKRKMDDAMSHMEY
jgi:hypothetical protein